jgi:NAD(P)-dependent dehydrogenase (short-subunit alcohol dehydrogenase family)
MPNWTANDIPDQMGKVAIVTGANCGVGYETARALASKGATVIMACRNEEKGTAAAQTIRDEYRDALIDWLHLDLADLSSIRHFVEEFLGRYDQLHLLINNAGVMMIPELRRTVDGFEMQFGTNHLGHFALTGLLLDTINRTPDARVVTVSSSGHRQGRMDFANLNAEVSYSRIMAYTESKLANLLFTYELQRRFETAGARTIAVASHPGWTATNLQRDVGLFRFFNPFFAMQPEQGALPTLYAATAPDVQGGDYYGPDGFGEMRGYPKKVESSQRSQDMASAEKLWQVSEELTGIPYQGL